MDDQMTTGVGYRGRIQKIWRGVQGADPEIMEGVKLLRGVQGADPKIMEGGAGADPKIMEGVHLY